MTPDAAERPERAPTTRDWTGGCQSVGRKTVGAEVSVDGGLHVLAKAPEKFADEDRQDHDKIVPGADPRKGKREDRTVPVLLHAANKTRHDQQEVDELGNKRCDAGALNPESGSTEGTEDQHVVETGVHKHRNEACKERNPRVLLQRR